MSQLTKLSLASTLCCLSWRLGNPRTMQVSDFLDHPRKQTQERSVRFVAIEVVFRHVFKQLVAYGLSALGNSVNQLIAVNLKHSKSHHLRSNFIAHWQPPEIFKSLLLLLFLLLLLLFNLCVCFLKRFALIGKDHQFIMAKNKEFKNGSWNRQRSNSLVATVTLSSINSELQ